MISAKGDVKRYPQGALLFHMPHFHVLHSPFNRSSARVASASVGLLLLIRQTANIDCKRVGIGTDKEEVYKTVAKMAYLTSQANTSSLPI